MQDPALYLNGIGAEIDCIVRPGRAARIDRDYAAFVNHEVYFFADGVARHRFRRDPLKWCGRLSDPVTQERFDPDRRSPRAEWNGRPYYFASDSTRALFAAAPAKYADPRGDMTAAPAPR